MSLQFATDEPYWPHRDDVTALMANQYTTHTLGRIPAVRRRVLKLLCPSRPEHQNLCLSILHTLHDVMYGAHQVTDDSPAPAQTHHAAADAILSFEGLPAKSTATKEQQFRKLAKDVLLCCTDRALTLLLHTLSLGPPDPPPDDAGGWHGRVRRITLITSATDFLVAPKATACAHYASVADDSELCGPLPRPGAAPRPEPAFLPVEDECPVLAALSGRRAAMRETGDDTAERSDGGDAGSDVPQPEGSEEAGGGPGRRLRRTDSSLAEATAAAETLTQLVAAAHAAARLREAGGDEAGTSADAVGTETTSFVSEVLQEAQRALTLCSGAQAELQQNLRSGGDGASQADEAARSPTAAPDEGPEAPEPPAKARRVARAGRRRAVDAGEGTGAGAAAHAGGETGAGASAHWTQPDSPGPPTARGDAVRRPVRERTVAGRVDASVEGDGDAGARGRAHGVDVTSDAEAAAAGVAAATGRGARVSEAVRRAEVMRGPGQALQALPVLWRNVEACAERETAAQLLHKALAGVPGRNKRVRLQMFAEFAGVAAQEAPDGQRLELRLGVVRQCLSTATVRPHIAALARLLMLPDDVCRRAADTATVASAIDYILDFLVSPSAAHLRAGPSA